MLKNIKAFSSFSVDNMEKAKQFYGKILGLNIERTPEGSTLHIEGGVGIFIYEKSDHTPATFTVLNFLVDKIEETVDKLAEAGVQFEHYDIPPYIKTDKKGIARGENGPRAMAWFKDPAGNIISVIQEK